MNDDRIYRNGIDYKALKRRIAVARSAKENAEKAKFIGEYVTRCARRFREAKARTPKGPIDNIFRSTAALAHSETTQVALAGLVLGCFAIWIGAALFAAYSQQNERAFAEQCSRNNLSYSSNYICHDEQGHVHTLNPDGTAKKGALDRKVWRESDFAEKAGKAL